jgi:hypothetical protein
MSTLSSDWLRMAAFEVKIPPGETIEIDLRQLRTGKVIFDGPALDPKALGETG